MGIRDILGNHTTNALISFLSYIANKLKYWEDERRR